ncbi:MAG: hypothetical protein ACRERV_01280 [Methylococcales bacterium]
MKAKALNESYSICGKKYCFFTKTGSYKKEEREPFYRFLKIGAEEGYDEYESEKTAFVIPLDQNLSRDIDLKNGDPISIVLFGEDSRTYFLLLNYRNFQNKYYPEAFEDLFSTLRDDYGWFKRLRIKTQLKGNHSDPPVFF